MSTAALHEPFQAPDQQRRATFLGMYLFLATEIMLFGAIVATLAVYRYLHPAAARAASQDLNLWLGGLNTAVLLTSSLLVALAVAAARDGLPRPAARWLAGAAVLGLLFLAVKGIEYHEEYREGLMPLVGPTRTFLDPSEQLFLHLYFVATGLHAVHLTIGIVLVVVIAARIRAARLDLPRRAIVVEMTGLYWHLVDVVWVFLYPLLYLAR